MCIVRRVAGVREVARPTKKRTPVICANVWQKPNDAVARPERTMPRRMVGFRPMVSDSRSDGYRPRMRATEYATPIHDA